MSNGFVVGDERKLGGKLPSNLKPTLVRKSPRSTLLPVYHNNPLDLRAERI